MLKLLVLLLISIVAISTYIFKYVNEPSDWNIPRPLTLLDAHYVVMSSLTSVGFTSNLFPASERSKRVVIFLELLILLGVILAFQNKFTYHL